MLVDKTISNVLISCHEDNEKKRCPICKSLNTKKHGFINSNILSVRGIQKRKIQRFFCKECHKSFTSQGHNKRQKTSTHLKNKAVKDFVHTKNSLQEVADRYQVSKTSVLNWLKKTASDISDNFKPLSNLDDVLLIDGKEIKVNGNKKVLLISKTFLSKKIAFYSLYNSEDITSSIDFLTKIKELYKKNNIQGIVSDFGRGKCFLKSVKETFPTIPHQVCNVHFMRYLWLFLPRSKKNKNYEQNKKLKELIKNILYAPNKIQSLNNLKYLNSIADEFKIKYQKRFIRSINHNYDYLTKHYDYSFLPTTTNLLENYNRQIERKLKNLDGFKSENNLKAFLKIRINNEKK